MAPLRIVGLVLALAVALLAVLIPKLGKVPRYEVLSRLFYPAFRLGWSTGLLPTKVMLRQLDDTSFLYMGDATPEEIRDWRVSPGDVVVSTWAKSGTHLAAQTALQVLSEASVATGDDMESIHQYMVSPEITTPRAMSTCDDTRLLHMGNYKELDPLNGTNLVVTHLDFNHTVFLDKANYLIMLRDPLDVLASLHTMISKLMGRCGPAKEELLPLFEQAMGGWAEWIRDWWQHRDAENVLIYFYEDSVKDPSAFVAAVTKLLGKPRDPDVAARVLERTSVKYMKARPDAFDPPKCLEPPLPIKNPYATSVMVNKGKTGGGQKESSEWLKHHVRQYCQRVFAGTDFPVEKLPGCN